MKDNIKNYNKILCDLKEINELTLTYKYEGMRFFTK